MKDSQKDGYIAGTLFVFLGIYLLVTSFDQGILTGGKITGILGAFLSLIGIGSFINPNIAETLVHWAQNQQRAEQKTHQTQKNNKNSHQVSAGGNVTINQNIYGGKK